MANPIHPLADRMRDVRLSAVLALAMLALAAIDAISPTFTPTAVDSFSRHITRTDIASTASRGRSSRTTTRDRSPARCADCICNSGARRAS